MSTRNLLANVDLSSVERDYTWYSVATLVNCEESYIRNLKEAVDGNDLQDYVKEYYVPMQYYKESPEDTKIKKTKGAYAGYVFVKCIMSSRIWNILRTTRGVAVVLMSSGVPHSVAQEEIDNIKSHMAPKNLSPDEEESVKKKLLDEYVCKNVVRPELSDAEFNTDFTA